MMSTRRRPRRRANRTRPSDLAKSVSSLPRPTFTPGWKCVPRWRTIIEPALTDSPSEAFTPRRCALESRPFRVEPPPLVLDISLLVGGRDRRDLDRRVVLTVAPATAATRLGLVVVGVDLRARRLP